MNLIAFGLILICCHAWAIEIDDNSIGWTTYARKTKLENFLENFKSTLRTGDSSLGLPVLDPFIASVLPVQYNEKDKINIDAVFRNLKVDGLSSYRVNSANFKLIGLKANADLTWPLITATTNYSMNASAFGFDVYGNGGLNASAREFTFKINIGFSLKGKHIQIKKISTFISLGSLDLHASGLYNNDETSEIMSKTISDMVPQIIRDYQKDIVNSINDNIMRIVNPILSNISLKDLLKMLGL